MNRSEIFRNAHKVAKATAEKFNSYREALSAALKAEYANASTIVVAHGKTSSGVSVVVTYSNDAYTVSANDKSTKSENPLSYRNINGKKVDVIQLTPADVKALFGLSVNNVMLVKADFKMAISQVKYAKQIKQAKATNKPVVISKDVRNSGIATMYATPCGNIERSFNAF